MTTQALPTTFTLPDSLTHYLADVLRVRPGTALELCDSGTHAVYYATVRSVASQITVTIESAILAKEIRTPALHLFFALCKGERNELLCDWATELGCHGIHFWQATRSVVRLKDPSDLARKRERFEKVARSASQQSKRLSLPAISVSSSLASAIDSITSLSEQGLTPHVGLFGALIPQSPPLSSLEQQLTRAQTISVAIGPEGDFTKAEIAFLQERGFLPISLGPQTLRSELAALTCIVAINAVIHPID